MESLKPLKIIGVIALLCLVVYLAIPDGRLNTMAALRGLGFPKYDAHNSFKGKYAAYLESSANLALEVGNKSEPLTRDKEFLQTAIELNDPVVCGIASRNITPFIHLSSKTPVEQRNTNRILELSEQLTLLGQKLDPENAFFPLQLATIAKSKNQSDLVREYLYQAAECPTYQDYGYFEGEITVQSLVFKPSQVEYWSRLAATNYRHLSPIKETIKQFIADIPPSQNIQDRLTVIKVGRLMATKADSVIVQLIGKSIVRIGLGAMNPLTSNVNLDYPLNELTSIAEDNHLDADNFLKQAYALATDQTPVPYDYFGYGVDIFGPAGYLMTGLAIPVLLVFVVFVTMILLAQNFTDRRWVKPIRYLALVPLSLAFAQSEQSFNFHLPTVVTILVVSLPIALISFTEKFVPVIHLTIVAISVYFFEKSTVLSQVLFHISIMAALVLLTWQKNRSPEGKFSKLLSTLLVFAVLGVTIMWFPAALNSVSGIASPFIVLGTLVLSSVAIVDSDRQLARKQANIAASLGLATFAACAVLSIRTSHLVLESFNREKQIPQSIAQTHNRLFPDPIIANIPTPPDVKKNK